MLALCFELGVRISNMDHSSRHGVLGRGVRDIGPKVLFDVCSDLCAGSGQRSGEEPGLPLKYGEMESIIP